MIRLPWRLQSECTFEDMRDSTNFARTKLGLRWSSLSNLNYAIMILYGHDPWKSGSMCLLLQSSRVAFTRKTDKNYITEVILLCWSYVGYASEGMCFLHCGENLRRWSGSCEKATALIGFALLDWEACSLVLERSDYLGEWGRWRLEEAMHAWTRGPRCSMSKVPA